MTASSLRSAWHRPLVSALAATGLLMAGSTSHAQVDPWIGQVVYFGFDFCPPGYVEAAGQTVSAEEGSDYIDLFAVFQYTYGGSGTTFRLPDLRGNYVMHQGNGPEQQSFRTGQNVGTPRVALTSDNAPRHAHGFLASTELATSNTLAGGSFSEIRGQDASYAATAYGTLPVMNTGTIGPAGDTSFDPSHPFLGLLACIAFEGRYPTPGSPGQSDEEPEAEASNLFDAPRRWFSRFSGGDREPVTADTASEIVLLAGDYCPSPLLLANGQVLPVNNQNSPLLAAIGYTYGSQPSQASFGTPDLQGRVPVGYFDGNYLGSSIGQYSAGLTMNSLPEHTHPVLASSAGPTTADPATAAFATFDSRYKVYWTGAPNTAMARPMVGFTGEGMPFSITSSSLVMTYCLVNRGWFPYRPG